jgi:phospholipase C
MPRIHRRDFLKAAGAAFGLSLLPPALRKALAGPVPSGTLGSIAHVVIFSQENRSFDHYFGSMRGVLGFGDPHPATIQGTGRPVFFQRQGDGSPLGPWPLDARISAAQCAPDVLHDWKAQQGTYNRGRMDQWASLNGPFAMSHYRRGDLPWHFALADAFTVCDQFFSSARTSTAPNRLYLMTGTVDARERYGDAVITNSFASGGLKWTTYPERLQKAGISWRVYQEQDNYDDNALAWFEQFVQAPEGSPLHENGMKRRVFDDFAADVSSDRLPAVSWIIAPTAQSEHPPFAPNWGANYVNRYLQVLAAHPKVWQKTVFLLVYDENGGFFDHVPPPAPPPGTPDEFVNGYSLGLGARIPAIVCSPWSRGGWIASEVFDLTSTLQFLEKWTGVAEPNISAWRRAVCGDLTSCFGFASSDHAFPVLPDAAEPASEADRQCRTLPAPAPPASSDTLPSQEPGRKPLRIQPYSLECWLTSNPAALGGTVWVHWINDGDKAAALQVSARQYRSDGPWFYLAEPNLAGSDYFRCGWYGDGYYDLELHGPNQFYRRFRGYCDAKAWNGQREPDIKLVTQGVGRPVALTFHNPAPAPAEFVVTQRNGDTRQWTVPVPAGSILGRDLPTMDDWYDYRVVLVGDDNFLQEMAGHVEGAPGLTRPGALIQSQTSS